MCLKLIHSPRANHTYDVSGMEIIMDATTSLVACSGTTGDPKGVLITHQNMVSGIAALVSYTEHVGIAVTSEDSTLSYLPLAHIFDRIAEEFVLSVGARIGYSQACPVALHTLTTCTVQSIRVRQDNTILTFNLSCSD